MVERQSGNEGRGSGEGAAVLEAEDVRVIFQMRSGFFEPRSVVRAVNGVSLQIGAGETVGLVGESGSGKSTLGRAFLRLVPIDGGTVRVGGVDITDLSRRELRPLRSQMQMVFQDPYSSLDPSMTVADSIGEPLVVHADMSKNQRNQRVLELLRLVGLSEHHLERFPSEFSGGQRQRIAIARAIAVNPQLVILDEAVSALDVSTQTEIVNLLEGLREDFDLAYLFIAHDLSVVRHISHRVIVMYLGQIMEEGPTERLYRSPAHPYTQSLLSAAPIPDPRRQRERQRIVLKGDLPDPTEPITGCPFHGRCPYVMDICKKEMPGMTPVVGGGLAACHLHTTGPELGGQPIPAAGLQISDEGKLHVI